MNKRLQQLKALSAADWRLLLKAMLLLPLVALSLRLSGFGRSQQRLAQFLPDVLNTTPPGEAALYEAHRVARMVQIAAGHGPYHGNCLKQALVVWFLLARRNILSEIRFGVPKQPGAVFSAHAWVECNGINLSDNDTVQEQFAAFQRS